MATVIVYGSSSANGLGDYEAGGLASRLKTEFNRRHELLGQSQHVVRDRSTTAERVTTTRAQLAEDIADPRLQKGLVAAVFSLGVYDSSTRISTGRNQISLPDFIDNARKIGRMSLDSGFKTMFIGMTPLHAHSVKLNERDVFTEKQRAEYERQSRIIADELSIPFLDIYSYCGGSHGYGFVSKDKVHPGVEAHKVIHTFVQRQVDEYFKTDVQTPAIDTNLVVPLAAMISLSADPIHGDRPLLA